MSRPDEHEVVVLGGGPAGCAAAALLAARGHEVALVRPATPPAGALGESVPPSARKLLSELRLLDAVESAGFAPNTGNTVWWAREPARSESFATAETGFHTDRSGLERALGEAAQSVGVRLLEAWSARSAEEGEDGWTVRCVGDDDEPLALRAPWVLDATGRHGLLARREGRRPDRDTTTLALVARWRRPGGWEGSDHGHTRVESYEDGWAWSVPLDDEVRCFTAMVDQRHAELEGVDVRAMLEAELTKTEHVATDLAVAEPVGEGWACPASLYTAERHGRPGLLLVGDAGSFIDPLSSYGVKKALSSGWLAGIAAHTALADATMTEVAVGYFDDRERAVYRRYRRASARFFESAADAYGTAYWADRARAAGAAGGAPEEESDPDSAGEPAVPEATVRAAFDDIRGRPRLEATPGPTLTEIERPAVVGHRIVLAEHLASRAYPRGIRWVRGVDLRALVEVAPRHPDVPDGWSAYNGVAAPVTLPDYLTALATAFAAGLLTHADD